ncbi:MAG: hypothetical protein Q9M24_04335 [Mariprofundaceae bacterium]|nr:hypothetical protein [Mariprofundaceae bacterium]
MSISDFVFWPEHVILSVLVWAIILITLAYLARKPVHLAVHSFSRLLHHALKLAASSIMSAAHKLQQRNREVLLAAGREAAEHLVEREFERVDDAVRRDLAEYPALHRKLGDVVTKVDEDFQKSTEAPPSAPGWAKAVEAVAKIPSAGDPMVGNVLKSIHGSMVKANDHALAEYRKSSGRRHLLLKRMLPLWRKMETSLKQVDDNINSLIGRSKAIDKHMDEYEEIVRKTDRSEQMLSSSSLTQFFISAFVMAIAIGGAAINFNLIARPMAEMVGGGSMLMGFKTNSIAALVIILVEVAMGLFLMESLRITRLFPVIGALNDKVRIRMAIITFSIIFALANVEAGLAYMREILAQDDAALRAALLSGEAAGLTGISERWITTAAQMGMGFILPFALVFVAIPLESFVHSLRTVIGLVAVAMLRVTAASLRLLGNISRYTGVLLVHLYDLIIVVPLWVEKLVMRSQAAKSGAASEHEPQNMDDTIVRRMSV